MAGREPTKTKVVEQCDCGSSDFLVEYGKTVRCRYCDTVPKELSAEPIEWEYNYQLEVRSPDTGNVVRVIKISQRSF